MRTEALDEPAGPEVYVPLWQNRATTKHLVVRTEGEPMAVSHRVREAIRAVDPAAAVEHVKTMSELREESIAPRLFAMHLLVGFSAVATLLSLVGLYGALSLSVGTRVREMAVRRRSARSRRRSCLSCSQRAVACRGRGRSGTRPRNRGRPRVAALLFGVRPADLVTLAEAAFMFALLAIVTCAIPAWRAARVELIEPLRRD